MAATVTAAIACGGSHPTPPPTPAGPDAPAAPANSVAREAFQHGDAWYFVERYDDGTARAVRARGTEVSAFELPGSTSPSGARLAQAELSALEGTPRLRQDGPIAAGTPQLIPPDPARGFHWPYLLYIPEAPFFATHAR